jgi:thiol-disulfide isomerase/thioredoxin
MSNYDKYIKYKTKYLLLKNVNEFKGGAKNTSELFLFKASWCGHCNAFLPEWEKLNNDDEFTSKIKLTTYDSDENKDKMKQFKINGYPTLLLKTGDKLIEYEGKREVNDIKKFVESNI